MMNRERLLRLFLRSVGSVAALAALCAIMPFPWMDAAHRALGMGTLPALPVVGYLARSTSAFCALFGGLLWVVSFDLHRYRSLLRCIGVAAVGLGLFLFAVDNIEGLPWFWRLTEGPINVTIGAIVLSLSRGLQGEEC